MFAIVDGVALYTISSWVRGFIYVVWAMLMEESVELHASRVSPKLGV